MKWDVSLATRAVWGIVLGVVFLLGRCPLLDDGNDREVTTTSSDSHYVSSLYFWIEHDVLHLRFSVKSSFPVRDAYVSLTKLNPRNLAMPYLGLPPLTQRLLQLAPGEFLLSIRLLEYLKEPNPFFLRLVTIDFENADSIVLEEAELEVFQHTIFSMDSDFPPPKILRWSFGELSRFSGELLLPIRIFFSAPLPRKSHVFAQVYLTGSDDMVETRALEISETEQDDDWNDFSSVRTYFDPYRDIGARSSVQIWKMFAIHVVLPGDKRHHFWKKELEKTGKSVAVTIPPMDNVAR